MTPEEQRLYDLKMMRSFSYYAPRALKVQTMEGKLVPFALNEPQKILNSIIRDIRQEGRLVRLMILKARREGISTYTEGRFYWKTTTNKNRYAVCVTHEPEATSFLFKMTKRFHDNCPVDYKVQEKYSNQNLLEFNSKTPGEGLDSAFRVGTAGKQDFGSGQLIHYLHLSEVAKWPRENEKALLDSLLQCVPDEPDTEIFFESTAKGVGGEFYDRYHKARFRYSVVLKDGKPVIQKSINTDAALDNCYNAIFLPWFVFPKYRMKVPPDFARYKKPKDAPPDDNKECEETLVKLYGLSDEQLVWRRYTIANKCGGLEATFKQEYPSNPIECFLSSGRPVFDNFKLLAQKNAAPKPVQRYEPLISSGQWLAKPEGRLLVWEEPKPGRAYVIGADVAEGLEHGDFSCADVIDHLTGAQVAHWHGHIDPDQWGKLLFWLGTRYNLAWLGVERNNHGITTLTTLTNLRYRRLYAEMVPEPPGKPRRRFGWLTSTKTRPQIIDGLIEEMRDNPTSIRNAATLGEMMSFKIQEDGKMEADPGMCDDRVLSLAIAKRLRKVCPLPSTQVQNALNTIVDGHNGRGTFIPGGMPEGGIGGGPGGMEGFI